MLFRSIFFPNYLLSEFFQLLHEFFLIFFEFESLYASEVQVDAELVAMVFFNQNSNILFIFFLAALVVRVWW